MVGADVRGRPLASDVLLSRLEDHREGLLLRVFLGRHPYQPAGHAAGEPEVPHREDPQVGAAVVHRNPEWLPLAHNDVCSVLPWRLDDREREGVYPHHEKSAPLVQPGREVEQPLLKNAEVVRVLDVDSRHLGGYSRTQSGEVRGARPAVEGESFQLKVHGAHVRLDDL